MSDVGKRAFGVVATAVVAMGCSCGLEVHHATLGQAAGLAEGAPVIVAGVEVGHVQSVHVEGSDVDVAFTFEPDQHVTLRESACALALAPASSDTTPRAELVVIAGEGDPLPLERAVPQCQIPLDGIAAFVTSLGASFAAVRDTITAALEAIARSATAPESATPRAPSAPSVGGSAAGTTELPTTPLPTPTAPASPCAALGIVVERIEPVDAMPLLLPSGGSRLHLAVTNDGDAELTLPAVDDASFVDRDHRAMTLARVPGDGWFMPVPLPAHVTTSVTVVMSSDPTTLGELTIRGITSPGDPVAGCTVHQMFVSLPEPGP